METILWVGGTYVIGFAVALLFSFGIEASKNRWQHWFRLARVVLWPVTVVVYAVIFCAAFAALCLEEMFGDVWKNLRNVPKE